MWQWCDAFGSSHQCAYTGGEPQVPLQIESAGCVQEYYWVWVILKEIESPGSPVSMCLCEIMSACLFQKGGICSVVNITAVKCSSQPSSYTEFSVSSVGDNQSHLIYAWQCYQLFWLYFYIHFNMEYFLHTCHPCWTQHRFSKKINK